ncbi:MAG: hypothetical protein Q7T62_14715 [Undibacterium sp.]|nr:hypothetical protein [Undibacterium sp.]
MFLMQEIIRKKRDLAASTVIAAFQLEETVRHLVPLIYHRICAADIERTPS